MPTHFVKTTPFQKKNPDLFVLYQINIYVGKVQVIKRHTYKDDEKQHDKFNLLLQETFHTVKNVKNHILHFFL